MIRALVLALALALPATAQDKAITLASTTSTQNSGLYDHILPMFEAETGIRVLVIAVGTGQALRIARNGDADVLIVHHRPSEEAFVAEGFGVERRDLMVNDFVIVGPPEDPADVASASDAAQALARIARSQALFISRGDDSGTHLREQELWTAADLAPDGTWYREIGASMGAALNMASVSDAYLLTDRGTWLAFNNKGRLVQLFEGDPKLMNPYSVILVNAGRHPHIDAEAARQFANWLTSDRGQQAIANFRVGGQTLFCPASALEPASKGCEITAQ